MTPTPADLGCHRTTQSRPFPAAAPSDRNRGRHGGLHAGRQGPVGRRHQDDTNASRRRPKIKVADGEMPGYFARPDGVANPPSCWWRWDFSACTNTSRT